MGVIESALKLTQRYIPGGGEAVFEARCGNLNGFLYCKVVMSPFIFLINANELLQELDRSGFIYVSNMSYGDPAVADDMSLLSLSKCVLGQMIRICYNDSCKWRYEYSFGK